MIKQVKTLNASTEVKDKIDCQSTWQMALGLVVAPAAALATWQVCPKTGYGPNNEL